VFEGAMKHLARLAPADFVGTAVGCYDYDPIASFLPFPVHMMRQNAEGLVARAFALIDAGTDAPVMDEVAPDLLPPRTIHPSRFKDLG
jgi:LacI family fructose operon transcriptional repressor